MLSSSCAWRISLMLETLIFQKYKYTFLIFKGGASIQQGHSRPSSSRFPTAQSFPERFPNKSPLFSVVLNPGCILQSLGECFKVPVPRPIKSESLEKGPRHSSFSCDSGDCNVWSSLRETA